MPTFFCLVILFLIWFTYERKKNATDYSKSKKFWERERQASYVPKQSTDDIEYITIPDGIIPRALPDSSEELKSAVEDIESLKDAKICDLSEFSNTDLRLKYGTANFNDLSKADNNYTRLVQWSGKLLTYLDEEGRIDEARDFIEFLRLNNVTSQIINRYSQN